MNWKAIATSAKGASHVKQQLPCQDYGDYKIVEDTIIGVIADGAGSAKHSDIGAKLAVKTVLEQVTATEITAIAKLCDSEASIDQNSQPINSTLKFLKSLSWNKNEKKDSAIVTLDRPANEIETREFFSIIVDQVINALSTEAKSKGYSIDDLACTLLIVIASPSGIAAMQIGDGFITVRYPQKELELLFAPDKGEYINETTFITSTNALKDMKVVITSQQPKFICASTDGLERLAIQISNWNPFAPFFNPLEQYLRETENLESDSYLINFLNSERLNARTDDDKTLFLCLHDQSNSG